MKTTKIKYNPRLTPEQNAKKNGVSVSAIRYHIKTQGIDRRYDKKVSLIEDCRAYLSKSPDATKTEVAKATKHSLTTIREYWQYITTEEELSVFDSNKAKKCQLRQLNDFYATHPSAVRALLDEESFNSQVLEPFCGTGMISKVLIQHGYDVSSYDIVDRGFGEVADFFELEVEPGKYDIVSNPPYGKLAYECITRCIELCKDKVALLFPLRVLAGRERYESIYKHRLLSKVYVFVDRVPLAKNGEFEKYNASTQKDEYAWFVFEREHQGDTIVKWIYCKDKDTF